MQLHLYICDKAVDKSNCRKKTRENLAAIHSAKLLVLDSLMHTAEHGHRCLPLP